MTRAPTAALAVLLTVAALAAPRPVKCIVSGFEIVQVSAEELLANADALDRLPFDGVTVYVYLDLPDGTRLTRDRIMGDSNWTRENVTSFVPILRQFAGHRSLRESLLTFRGTTTNHLDWTDDAAWARAGERPQVAWRRGGDWDWSLPQVFPELSLPDEVVEIGDVKIFKAK